MERPRQAFLRITEIRSLVTLSGDKSLITMVDGTTYKVEEPSGHIFEDQIEASALSEDSHPYKHWIEVHLVKSLGYRIRERLASFRPR